MGWWRSKTSGEKRTDQHGDDSTHRADVGVTGEAAIVKAIAEGVARGVTDALLDRVKPGMVERVKGMFR